MAGLKGLHNKLTQATLNLDAAFEKIGHTRAGPDARLNTRSAAHRHRTDQLAGQDASQTGGEAALSEFFAVEGGTWKEVRDLCLMEGGDLASILSKEEADKAALVCPHMHCYIGLTRGAPGQPFFWLDGSPVKYTAWDNEQPQAVRIMTY